MILTLTTEFSAPSQLWMRRMCSRLSDISPEVIELSGKTLHEKYEGLKVVCCPASPSSFRRLKSRLRLDSDAWSNFRIEWIARRVQKANPEAIFVHFLSAAAPLSCVWRSIDIPILVFCHGFDVTWDLKNEKGMFLHHPEYVRKVQQLPANVTFLANSTVTAAKLSSIGISDDRIDIFRFGISTDRSPNWARLRHNNQALFLGRIIDLKGPLETIKALSIPLKSGDLSKLVIAGSGNLEEGCRSLVKEKRLSRFVNFTGVVSEQEGTNLRNLSSIFTAHNKKSVVTNQEEALGVSLLEAMGSGLPVVTGRSGGIPDFIENCYNGFLFEPGDIESHQAIICELLADADLRIRIGKRAFDTVQDRFSVDREKDVLLGIVRKRVSVRSRARIATQ